MCNLVRLMNSATNNFFGPHYIFYVGACFTWRRLLQISYILSQDNMKKQKNQVTQNDCQLWAHPLHQINRQSKQLARCGGGGLLMPHKMLSWNAI